MSGILISCVRLDSKEHMERLHNALATRYGEDKILYDGSKKRGLDFSAVGTDIIDSCDVMVAVFGRNSRMPKDAEPDFTDFILDPMPKEISDALKLNKRIVPVLINGGMIPEMASLPADLRPIAFLHAIELSDERWDESIKSLYQPLDEIFPVREEKIAPLRGLNILREAADKIRESATPQNKTQSPESHQIFVSHAAEDREFVETLVAKLEEDNFRCWVSYRDIPAGVPAWSGVVVGAVGASKLMVVVVSRNAVASKQVLREVTIADNKNIPFIPFCVDETPLPDDFDYFFSTAQRLHAANVSESQALIMLASAVKRHGAVSD